MIKRTAEINIKSDANEAAKGITNVKKELREANALLIEAQQNFGDYSDQALTAARNVAVLRDSISEARETAALFDPGAKFQAVTGVLSAVAGGFSVVTGAMGALGAESEEVEQMLLKVNSALALTSGLSAVADSAKDFKRFGSIAKQAFTSVQASAKTTFTGIKGGIAATGIGIFLIALGLIVANWDEIRAAVLKAFPAFNDMGEMFNKLKQYAFGAGEVIIAYVLAPFKALGKVLKGDFAGALDEVKNGLSVTKNFAKGVSKEMQSQADDAAKERLQKQIEANEKSLEIAKAAGKDTYKAELDIIQKKKKLNKDNQEEVEKLNQEERVLRASHSKKLADIDKAAAEKSAAKKKADKAAAAAEQKANDDAYLNAKKTLEKEIEDLEDVTAQNKLDTQKQRELESINSLKGQTDAELQILRDAHEKKFAILQTALNKEEKEKKDKRDKEIQAGIDATHKEVQSIVDANVVKKSLSDAKNVEELESLFKQLQSEQDIKQAAVVAELEKKQAEDLAKLESETGQGEAYKALKAQQAADVAAVIKSQDEQDVASKASFSEAKKKIDEKESENKLKMLDVIGSGLSSAADELGESTIAGKALAVAGASISTYTAIAGTLAAFSKTTVPGYAIAQAVATGVFGLLNVKKILSVKVPSKKGGGSGGAAGSLPTASKPSVAFQNTPQTQITDTIERTSQQRNAEPIRAYVVASDQQTADAIERNRIDSSRF